MWAGCTRNPKMSLLTFKDKYQAVDQSTLVTNSTTALADDTAVSLSVTVETGDVLLIIYQANNAYNQSYYQYGAQYAVNIGGTDYGFTWDGTYYDNYCGRGVSFWVGTLPAGDYTIKGRFASQSAGNAVSVSNRVLLALIFSGTEYGYVGDLADNNFITSSYPFVNDAPASGAPTFTFTPSGPCVALFLYNMGNVKGATDFSYGKKAAIQIAGTDYGQAEKKGGQTNGSNSTFTFYIQSLNAVSTTVRGRVAAQVVGSGGVSVTRRQFAYLLFDPGTLADLVDDATQVSTNSNVLVDDPQAAINRTITDTRELFMLGLGTVRHATPSSHPGMRYGLYCGSDLSHSRSGTYSARAQSAATFYAVQKAAAAYTIKGRFSNNTGTSLAVVDARLLGALWFATAQNITGAGGIVSAESFGTPGVLPGAVTLSPTGIESAEVFGAPAILPGAVTLEPPGIFSQEAFGLPEILIIPGEIRCVPQLSRFMAAMAVSKIKAATQTSLLEAVTATQQFKAAVQTSRLEVECDE